MTSAAVNSILANADYFVLLLFRVGALFISSPIFGRVNIPQMAKINFLAILTYFFFIVGPAPTVVVYSNLLEFAILIAKEVLLGVLMGYTSSAFFNLTYTAGHIMDMQMGFGMVNIYDAQTNAQVPITGTLLNILLTLIFFLVNGHQRLIYLVYLTLEAMPIGSTVFSGDAVYVVLQIFSEAVTLGVMVALPMIASGLTIEITFGALVRTVPQLNMFVVGIPMKTMIGFIMLIVIIPVFAGFSETIFSSMFAAIEQVFAALRGV